MYKGPIIDTHMHIWDVANGIPWLPEMAGGILNHNFLISDYREMSKNEPISHMVYVECGAFPQNRIREVQWVQEQADRYGAPHGIVGFAQLNDPEVETTLQNLVQYPNLRGIRMPLNYVAGCFGAERDDYMRDPAWKKGYSVLSKHKLLFEMQIFDTQIPDACEIAKAYPETVIILEHLGWPLQATLDDLPLWKNRLAQIAQYPNVFLKLSCLGWIFQKNDESMILPYIQEALKLFGADRCMVGSNCPPDSIFISFDEIMRLFKAALSSYPEADQEKVFYSNAKRLYRLR